MLWTCLLIALIACIHSSYYSVLALVEAPDGSVCFNGCSGHGTCEDYSCKCFTGFHGDDCSTTYLDNFDNIVPILGAGHFNLTRKNFTQGIIKHKQILVGFSSYNCHKCIVVERDYQAVAEKLAALKIPFARADADKLKSITIENGANELPALVWFNRQRPSLFRGPHVTNTIMAYVQKQLDPPIKMMKTKDEALAFLSSRKNDALSLTTVTVLGVFSDHKGIEEDEFEEFLEAANEYHSKDDIYFGAVTTRVAAAWFKENKTIDRTPAAVLIGESETPHVIYLDEMYNEKAGLKEWILRKSVPVVGKLSPQNFGLYEKSSLPMLMLFLDLTNEMQSSAPGRVVGGRSGGILNEILLEEFKVIANEYSDKINFVFIDGIQHQDKMRSLGLYGGAERLPSLAFNTRDRRRVPFPEDLPINRDTLNRYCAEFLSGNLRTPEDSLQLVQKALQSTTPLNTKNTVTRKQRKSAPKSVTGVSEQFGDGAVGDNAVVEITSKNFDEIAMSEDKDVLILFHEKGCEPCSHLSVYYKRMAERFKQMNIESLVVARMDLTEDAPPADLNMIASALPLLVLLPAGAKYPPWNYYSGLGKVGPMMKWAQEQASIKFELPNLPHLDEKNRVLYKQQVREREEYLEKKRNDDKKAMEEEELKQKEFAKKQQERSQAKADSKDKVQASTASELPKSSIDMSSKDSSEDHDEF